MPDEAMTWDEDTLSYGYILDRIAGGGWWHLHFGRSAWSYHCELLSRRIDVLACVQRFAAGGVAEFPPFLLTLDGEGVEPAGAEARLDFRWGEPSADSELAAATLHFQREVLPLLHASPAFQQAVAEVLARQRHLRMVVSGKLDRAEQGAAANRPRE